MENQLRALITNLEDDSKDNEKFAGYAKTNLKEISYRSGKSEVYKEVIFELKRMVEPCPDYKNFEIDPSFMKYMIDEVSYELKSLEQSFQKNFERVSTSSSFIANLSWIAEDTYQIAFKIEQMKSFLNFLENEPNRVVEYLTHNIIEFMKILLTMSPYESSTNQISNLNFLWKRKILQDLNNEYLQWLTRIDRKMKTNFHEAAILDAAKVIC